MPSKDKIVHLLDVLSDTMEIHPRDLAAAALDYANRVFNDPDESQNHDDEEGDAPTIEGREHTTRMSTPAAQSYTGPIHLCLDFGTAVSKAFAWNKVSDTPMPLKIGTAAGEPASSPYGLVSTIFIARDGKVYFGQAAINHAAAVADPERHRSLESIKDILSVGQKEGLTEPVSSECNPSGCPITRKEIIALYLAFLTDSALLALRDDYGEEHRYLPRSYTKPVFDQSRDEWATETLAECAALGQVLADRFSEQWRKGISLEDLRSAFNHATTSSISSGLNSQFLPEPVGAFASRLRNYEPESQYRRLMMVIDVGAGTTDFAMFAAFESDNKMRLVRIKDSVKTVRIGGDAVDSTLLEFLLDRAGVTSGDSRIGAIRADLRRHLRLSKEELFRKGTLEQSLINDIKVTVQRDDFERCDGMIHLQDVMSDKFREALSAIHKSWLSLRELQVFFTGGGGSLNMVTNLVRNQDMRIQDTIIRLRAASNLPDWIETECEEIIEFYPQLAVCIGAAAYDGTQTVSLVVDNEHSKFHGNLSNARLRMGGFRDGE